MALPEAEAAVCSTSAFGFCSLTLNQEVRRLTGCTTPSGLAITGTVTLSFLGTGAVGNGANYCSIPVTGDSVTRLPTYSITGKSGVVFSVAAVTTGQTITRTGATSFTFANTGIRRSFKNPSAVTILDITSSTTSPITITGGSRNARTLSGGGIRIVNNITSVSCSLSPAAVAWTTNCNCPTAGTWSGVCTDATTLSVAFSSTCGQALVSKGTDSSTVTMDRCETN